MNLFTRYEENYGYGKVFPQSHSLNQTFGQPIQSISYQPISGYTTGNLPVIGSTNYAAPSTNTYTPFTNTQFGSQKVSEYVFEGKMGS